jgi:hypothetical protein
MRRRTVFIGLAALVGILTWSSLLACGDKFLVVGRGTRYQRPKNSRAANVLIYANPASEMPGALKNLPIESVLKHEGHRSTRVETPEQLSAILAGGRFDVVLASSGDVPAVEKLLGASPEAPVMLSFCSKEKARAKDAACDLSSSPKEQSLLEAIDKAVERHDQNLKKAPTRS